MSMKVGEMVDHTELFQSVLKTLDEIAIALRASLWTNGTLTENSLNERYLHHLLTHQLQQGGCSILPCEGKPHRLYPEWPTWKQGSIKHRRYKCFQAKDQVNGETRKGFNPIPKDEIQENTDLGSAGFFDFCLGGSYENPRIGVELILKQGWSAEEFTFDFLKILDSALPFEFGLAYGVILRPNGLPKNKAREDVLEAMHKAVQMAVARLSSDVTRSRTYQLVVVEVAPEAIRRWVCTSAEGLFQETPLPTLAL